MDADTNPTIMNLTLEIRFIACVKRDFVHNLLETKYTNGLFGIPSPYEPHFEPLTTLLSRQIQIATAQRCQTVVEYLRRKNPGVREWTIFASDGLDKEDEESTLTDEEYVEIVQDLCGGSIAKAGIDQTLMPSIYRARLKEYIANNKSHYTAKILLLSPTIEIKSLDDVSWHAPLMAIFQSVLNPGRKESITFNFSKSTTLVYIIDPPKPVSLNSIKLFMGASQYLEEPLRNLQVSGYAENSGQTQIYDSTVNKHDNIPIGLRDVPDLKSESALWEQIKQCKNLDALKFIFCHTGSITNDLNPGTGTYDLSWMTSFREANVGRVEQCIGAIRMGFAMHQSGLDVITDVWKRHVRIKNVFSAIHFNLQLFDRASQQKDAKGLESWLDNFMSRTWDPKLRFVLYLATFIGPPETLVNNMKLPCARMAAEFMIRLGYHRIIAPGILQENIDRAPGKTGEQINNTTENEDNNCKVNQVSIFPAAPNAAIMAQTATPDKINDPLLRKLDLEQSGTSTFQNLKGETSDPTLKQMNTNIMGWLGAIDEKVQPPTGIQQSKEKPIYKNMNKQRRMSTADGTTIENRLEHNKMIDSKLAETPKHHTSDVFPQPSNPESRLQLPTPNQSVQAQSLVQNQKVLVKSKPLGQRGKAATLSPSRNDGNVSSNAGGELSAQKHRHSVEGNKPVGLVRPVLQQSSDSLSTGIAARPEHGQEQPNDNSRVISAETFDDKDSVSACTVQGQPTENQLENESGQPIAAIDTLGLFDPIRRELWNATKAEARLRMSVLKVKCLANNATGRNHSIAKAELGDLMDWRLKVFHPDSAKSNQDEISRLKEQMQHLHEAYGRAQGIITQLIQQIDHVKEISTAPSQSQVHYTPTHHQTPNASPKKE